MMMMMTMTMMRGGVGGDHDIVVFV